MTTGKGWDVDQGVVEDRGEGSELADPEQFSVSALNVQVQAKGEAAAGCTKKPPTQSGNAMKSAAPVKTRAGANGVLQIENFTFSPPTALFFFCNRG